MKEGDSKGVYIQKPKKSSFLSEIIDIELYHQYFMFHRFTVCTTVVNIRLRLLSSILLCE